LRLSDQVLRHAGEIAERPDVLEAERWASGWLGEAWLAAPLGDREPEHDLCMEVVGRACAKPSPHGLAAVAALRRVAPDSEHTLLDGTVEILTETQPAPPWLTAPAFTPVRAWRAVDVWDSERVLFIEYESADAAATAHTLMGQIIEAGGTLVAKLGVLYQDAVRSWERMRDDGEVPMPVAELPVNEALADLAGALRQTDMLWPRHDDEDFVEVRALAWTRCPAHLPQWPEYEPLADAERQELVETFMTAAGAPDAGLPDVEAVRSLAEMFLDYGDGYLHAKPLGWSPDTVAMFLGDWLPRKAILDAGQREALPAALRRWLRFALQRRDVDPQWIEPVVAAVDEYLPMFTDAFDDERSWGPAKQIVAELTARGVDVTDPPAVDTAIGELNAEKLARRLTDL
jgi:hypothetical protein